LGEAQTVWRSGDGRVFALKGVGNAATKDDGMSDYDVSMSDNVLSMGDYDVSLIQPIIRTAVQQHPERERLEELLSAGVQIRVREMEPHPEEPPPDSIEDIEYQVFIEDGERTIALVTFPGHMLRPPALGEQLGPAHIDVGAVQRPIPQVRLTISWPEKPDMPSVDLLLSRDEARNVAQSLRNATGLVQEMLDELGGWGD
jgi:hypothetical protein